MSLAACDLHDSQTFNVTGCTCRGALRAEHVGDAPLAAVIEALHAAGRQGARRARPRLLQAPQLYQPSKYAVIHTDALFRKHLQGATLTFPFLQCKVMFAPAGVSRKRTVRCLSQRCRRWQIQRGRHHQQTLAEHPDRLTTLVECCTSARKTQPCPAALGSPTRSLSCSPAA
jgi:hypothetical protein